MKINQLTVGIALLLSGSIGWAGEYPAANFQPKVVYQDSSIAAASPAPATAKSGCEPAAAQVKEVAEIDPKYPAANFQPKVVFSDIH